MCHVHILNGLVKVPYVTQGTGTRQAVQLVVVGGGAPLIVRGLVEVRFTASGGWRRCAINRQGAGGVMVTKGYRESVMVTKRYREVRHGYEQWVILSGCREVRNSY